MTEKELANLKKKADILMEEAIKAVKDYYIASVGYHVQKDINEKEAPPPRPSKTSYKGI